MTPEQIAIIKHTERLDKLELQNASLVQDVNLLNPLKPGVDILQGENGNFDNIPGSGGGYPVGVIASGNAVVNAGAVGGQNYITTVAHGLGYRPRVLCWVTQPASIGGETVQSPFQFDQWITSEFILRIKMLYFVDDTNIQFVVNSDGALGINEAYTFHWYVTDLQ